MIDPVSQVAIQEQLNKLFERVNDLERTVAQQQKHIILLSDVTHFISTAVTKNYKEKTDAQ